MIDPFLKNEFVLKVWPKPMLTKVENLQLSKPFYYFSGLESELKVIKTSTQRKISFRRLSA